MKKWIFMFILVFPFMGVSNDNIKIAEEFMGKGDFKTAEKYYKRAINDGSVEAMLNLGTIYTAQLNINEAEKLYLKAVENNSDDGYNHLLLLYYGQGKYELVEKYANRELFSKQWNKYKNIRSEDDNMQNLINIIIKHQKGLEQEFFIKNKGDLK